MSKVIVKNYLQNLADPLKELYRAKLKVLNNIDPYELNWMQLNNNLDALPLISRDNLLDFLLFRVSPETQKEIRAYKSLQAYVQFSCKWIKDIRFFKEQKNFIIIGKVCHSQKINDPLLCPWIVQSQCGEIICTHCNCIAGFGGVCTHVAAVLFGLEYASRNAKPEESVTDVLAYWIGPSKRKLELSKPLANIDFTNPKKKLEVNTESDEELFNSDSSADETPKMTSKEVHHFLRKCKANTERVALFAVVEGLEPAKSSVTNVLANLYNKENEKLSLEALQELGETVTISLTQENCEHVREETKRQSKSKKWFYHRTGRVTASIFKSVCSTDVTKPSISIIKSICYPERPKMFIKAADYGCKHEKKALELYLMQHRKQHFAAHLEKTGLLIQPQYPFFGATPDSILICPECGRGCVEVKCPYCARNQSIEEWTRWKKTCLNFKHGQLELDKNHSYYYQCQMQMALTRLKFCDFVIWTKEEIFVQRCEEDKLFWNRESSKANIFIKKVILPELLGKFFSNKARVKQNDVTLHPNEVSVSYDNPIPGPSGYFSNKIL